MKTASLLLTIIVIFPGISVLAVQQSAGQVTAEKLSSPVVQPPVVQPLGTAAPPADVPASPAPAKPAEAAGTEAAGDSPIPLTDLLGQLKQRLTTAEMEQAIREQLLERLNGVTKEIAQGEEHRTSQVQLRTRMEVLAEEAGKLRNPPAAEMPSIDVRETDTAQLETQLATLQVKLTEEQQRLAALQQRLNEGASARQTLQTQAGKLTSDLAALPTGNGTPDLVNPPPEQAVAELEQAARRVRLRAELNLLQTRLSLFDAETSLGLFQLRVTGKERLVAQLQKNLTEIREELETRRKAESEARLQQAQRDQQKITDPGLKDLVARSTVIAEANNSLVQEQIPRWQNELKRRSQQLSRIRDEGDKLKSRIDRFGTSGVVGVELLRYHQNLPSLLELENLLAGIETEQTRLEFDRLDYTEELTAAEVALENSATASADVQNLWSSKAAILRSIIGNNMSLFSVLADLNAECRTMLSVISSWEDYVSVQALWFPSHTWPALTMSSDAAQEWQQISVSLWKEWNDLYVSLDYRSWGMLIPDLLIMFALVAMQRRARTAITECSERAARRSCVMMMPTLKALLMTMIVAAVWPLLFILLGTTFRFMFAPRTVTAALCGAMIVGGFWFMLINFFRQMLRSGGLAEAHFGWDEGVCRFARSWLHQLILLMAFPGLVYWFLRFVPMEVPASLRLTFILLMLLIAIQIGFLWRQGRSTSGQTRLTRLSSYRNFRWLWITVALLIPLSLAGLSFIGYHYTATVLARRLVATVSVSSLLATVHALLERWLKVRRTRAALELARERAVQREKAMGTEGESSETTDSTIPPTPPPETDFEVLGVQAHALIRNLLLIAFGSILWAIWYEVLPALRVLSEYQLWQVADEVTAVATSEDNVSVTQTRIQLVWVTFGDLLFSAIAATITFVGVRFLPGFIEVMLLSRVAFDAGLRYAIITVTRYLLLLAGTVLVCQSIGIRWGNVQWLAAGLSVGLGFGLQEVFANFISGLIILFERPVRIGDIVTIDGVTGVVSRIRIRATSITDWDRREYIVPNKEFVTAKVLNWTLTDTTNRFVMNVGIGYGSDTVKAREILLAVAQSHPNILKDPAPVASFEGFGESSLQLLLRVYLPNMDNRLATISDLHTEILRRFSQEGIELPFPQRSLHIVSDARNQCR